MTETVKTVESTYFHINNGGLILDIEKVTPVLPNGQPGTEFYRLVSGSGTFGVQTTQHFPICSTAMCDTMIEMLMRVRMHMAENGFSAQHRFVSQAQTRVEGGLTVRARYGSEEDDGDGNKVSRFLGYELVDEDGTVVHFRDDPDPMKDLYTGESCFGVDEESEPPPWFGRLLRKLFGRWL